MSTKEVLKNSNKYILPIAPAMSKILAFKAQGLIGKIVRVAAGGMAKIRDESNQIISAREVSDEITGETVLGKEILPVGAVGVVIGLSKNDPAILRVFFSGVLSELRESKPSSEIYPGIYYLSAMYLTAL